VQEGVVRYGFMQMAFLSDASQWAAEATECAAEQNEPAFWLFHTKLFDNLTSDTSIPVTKDSLKAFAAELGLDTAAFSTCLDTGKYTQQIETETQSARDLGIKSTPTLFINGQMVQGAKSFEIFKAVIDAAAGLSPQTAAPSPNPPTITPATSGEDTGMPAAVAAARHFKGQPDAPVVMIELSNFL
jgi:protein-disulfide isomerase